jgi:glycosyltransferase involved in cell wall biosynthesis
MRDNIVSSDTTRRIAFVCTDPGIPVFGTKGAAVHAQSIIKVLVEAGNEVHVLTPRPGPVDGHQLADRVVVHRLPEIGRGAPAARERAAQASDRAVPMVLDTIDPQLVYERYALWGRSATSWARRHDVPSILEVNSPLIDEQATYRELADPAAAQVVARSVFSAATVISCVSAGVAAWVRGITGDDSRILTLPNGVDTGRIEPAARGLTTAAATPFVVGFLGTLKAWHGVDVLIDGMADLSCAPDGAGGWRLLVVGDGPLRDQLTARAAKVGVAAEFVGAVHPDQVGAQLQRMDIACAPYPDCDDHYFSPLKVYEYLAAGLPVVASSIGQIPDILDHGRLGRLVRPGDHRELAEALVQLRADGGERRRLATAGRDAAERRHTWTGVVNRVIAAAESGPSSERIGAVA